MQAIVLSGGQSMRMGYDKGLLNLADKTWVQAAVAKFAFLNIPVAVSINNQQYKDYVKILPDNVLIEDNQQLIIHGPLAGVLSAHLRYLTEDLFILACDLTLMEESILNLLYNQFKTSTDKDAFIFMNGENPEPLCGIYCRTGLAKVLKMYETKTLTRHSMKFILSKLNVHYIFLESEQKLFFKNFNAPTDFTDR